MADVFLSYAREDRARAEQVAQGLSAAGIEVFWDNEIPPGTTWADYIEQKLSQCKALIVLWSEHSAKSQWVREEARLGRDKGVLIPAMIDNVAAPFGFGEVQAANLAVWNGDLEHADWRRFVEAVRAALTRTPRPQPAPSAPPRAQAPAPDKEKRRVMPVWGWVAATVVATIAVLAVIGSMAEDETPQQQTATIQPAVQQPAQQPQSAQAAAASPQDVIMGQLQQAEAMFTRQGYQQVGQAFSGNLAQGQTWNVPVTMGAGIDYRVIGVCDQDCNDLDLVLYDASGAVISQDSSTDSQPVVSAASPYDGQFMLQVQMYNCTRAPCYYALALYGRRMN